MLRIRGVDGKVQPLHTTQRFVEIVDPTMNLAAVVYQDDNGMTHVCLPGEPDFTRYVQMFKQPHLTKTNHIQR